MFKTQGSQTLVFIEEQTRISVWRRVTAHPLPITGRSSAMLVIREGRHCRQYRSLNFGKLVKIDQDAPGYSARLGKRIYPIAQASLTAFC
jgi:hypothetical protein